MPDATALNLLGDTKHSYSTQLEMFYRFFMHYLDKEMVDGCTNQLIDQLQGLTFESINVYSKDKKQSQTVMTRALSVELSYSVDEYEGMFAHLLRDALQKRTELHSRNHEKKSWETITQTKKICIKSFGDQSAEYILPQVFCVSCCCQGVQERMHFWWSDDFLPDCIEITLFSDGHLSIKQFHSPSNSEKMSTSIPLDSKHDSEVVCRQRYSLVHVISYIHQADNKVSSDDEKAGHFVIHTRVPRAYEKYAREKQIEEIRRCCADNPLSNDFDVDLTRTGMISSERWREQLDMMQKNDKVDKDGDQWYLFNRFSVQPTTVRHVTNFNGNFREPCIVQFRAVSENNIFPTRIPSITSLSDKTQVESVNVVAIDTEFVSVQLEKSTITATGEKRTLVEGRSALARMSILNVRTGEVLIDDYVKPQEPVVDYLTRFSGIRPGDLDERNPRLVTTQTAYMKLRSLIDNGCIFIGHGLQKDFQVINLHVSPRQLIDTVVVFHKHKRRWISLRFLANYLLKRDMQQDVHDSVEDAKAALELFQIAVKLKREGTFDKVLTDIYSYGNEVDWKVA